MNPSLIPLPTFLPPGAIEEFPMEGWGCQGEPLFMERKFSFRPYDVGLTIIRWFDTSTLRAGAGESRVSEGMISGRPAVFIEPIVESGVGESWIAFADAGDLIDFAARDLRFSDLKAIAESFPLS